MNELEVTDSSKLCQQTQAVLSSLTRLLCTHVSWVWLASVLFCRYIYMTTQTIPGNEKGREEGEGRDEVRGRREREIMTSILL